MSLPALLGGVPVAEADAAAIMQKTPIGAGA
jgi:hypothetical protein